MSIILSLFWETRWCLCVNLSTAVSGLCQNHWFTAGFGWYGHGYRVEDRVTECPHNYRKMCNEVRWWYSPESSLCFFFTQGSNVKLSFTMKENWEIFKNLQILGFFYSTRCCSLKPHQPSTPPSQVPARS